MHAQCTSNAPPSQSHDTMHEQTIPITCTHKTTDTMPYIQRNFLKFNAIWLTHPSSELGVLPCHAWRPKTRGPGDSGRCTDVRIHHVVIGVPRCSVTRCRRSSKSTRHFFGIYSCPGRAHLGQVSTSGFWRSFPKDFETTKQFGTKEMWRGASICQSSNTTSTQACFSEVPQEELPFTFLAMFYSPSALYSASLSRFLPANIHHSIYACIYIMIEMSTYYILYTIPPTGKPVFCCTAPRHTSTTKHSTDCWQADMYACAVVPSWLP